MDTLKQGKKQNKLLPTKNNEHAYDNKMTGAKEGSQEATVSRKSQFLPGGKKISKGSHGTLDVKKEIGTPAEGPGQETITEW